MTPTAHRKSRVRGNGRRLVVALLGAVLTAGCTASERDTGFEVKSDQELIQQMLHRRSESLAGGNLNGYLEPVDSKAAPLERDIARGSTRVPLDLIKLVLREGFVAPKGPKVNAARVDFTYTYEELPDDNLFRFGLIYDLEQKDGTWRVTDAEPYLQDHAPPPPMWATGPVEIARSAHFIALYRPGTPRVDELLELAEQGRELLLPKLKLAPDPKYLILLAPNSAEYEQLLNNPQAADSIAVAQSLLRYTSGYTGVPQNRQIIVDLEKVLGDSLVLSEHEDQMVFPRQVFQHETGHLLLSRYDRATTPGWVKEGGAMYLAGERRIEEWRAGQAKDAFSSMSFADITGKGSLGGGLEYAYTNAAVSYLVKRFGPKRFWDFYRGFIRFEVRGAPTMRQMRADRTHRLLGLYYDMDEETLDRHARRWIEKAVS